MISVAMTTYNGEKYVEKQLISLLNQTCLPDEVIIVDDGSSDSTCRIVDNFIKDYGLNDRWKLIRCEENRGHLNSFFEAISLVAGDIIFLCDQDDIWLPQKIELMSNLMIENPNIQALSSSFNKIDSYGHSIKSYENFLSSNNGIIRKRIKSGEIVKISPFTLITYNVSPGCTSAFRKETKDIFINKLGKVDDFALVHDWKINLIAALNDGLYFVNTPTILYRLHSENTLGLSRNFDIESRISAYENAKKERITMYRISEYIEYGNSDDIYRKSINEYFEKMIKSYEERQENLKKGNLLGCFKTIFKFNLFVNRAFESVLVDIIAIINKKRLK
ncbi:glycosyltransferase [Psychrobacillus sp.]|uniref:glycosyltransferase n=1 Tax=Psychrobacillus sp. TaxID=1871623 RepID=UPI0028BE5E3D|nr:glycosyltransferase [Psychrobacillus sp.]